MKIAFYKPVHEAMARIAPLNPNYGSFAAKPSSHHVYTTQQVTAPTSPSEEGGHNKSNLEAGQQKLAGSFVMKHKS